MMRWFFALIVLLMAISPAAAAYKQVEVPLERLPQDHEYQRTLRDFMSRVTVEDLTVPAKQFSLVPTNDVEEQYKFWLLGQIAPDPSGVTIAPAGYTLASLESKKGILMPTAPNESQQLAWFVRWNYAGNPYFDSRPLKLRAFMLAATDMMILDYLYDNDPRGADRSDFLGGNLIWIGGTYKAVKSILPTTVQAAFEEGLKRHVKKLAKWGPKGHMTDMDLFASVGVTFIRESVSDEETKKLALDYTKLLYTDPRYFNKAGYFVDNKCFDTSYNGISLFFGSWAAVQGNDVAAEAMRRAFTLRAHLCFPSPDSGFSGPSHMSARCSSDPPRDQWQFPPKALAAGMISDDGLYLAKTPTPSELAAAQKTVIDRFNTQVASEKKVEPGVWKESHWSYGLNYAYDHYTPGYYARRLKLESENSPLLKPLYQRGGTFIHTFNDAFGIVKFEGYAAAVYTGAVGGLDGNWRRPYGMGGGQLSAFWTPDTGAVVLGRRRGIQGRTWDSFDEWRIWPVHAVSGVTDSGDFVSSCRIQVPKTDYDKSLLGDELSIAVWGVIPRHNAATHTETPTSIQYKRSFKMTEAGVRVRTQLSRESEEKLAELYETIPVLLNETSDQKPTTIEFRVGDSWIAASETAVENVTEARANRFGGAIRIAFKSPVTIKLSPSVWVDGYQTTAACRTLLIDLLDAKRQLPEKTSIEYTVMREKPKSK